MGQQQPPSTPPPAPRALPRISRSAPFPRLGRRRVYTLSYEQIHPVIRIAHRIRGRMNIGRRIIFDHELVLVTAGKVELKTDEGSRGLVAGEIVFVPPFHPHGFVARPKVEHVAVHFDLAPDLPPFANDPPRRRPYEIQLLGGVRFPQVARCPAGGEMRQAIDALLRAWDAGADAAPAPLVARVQLLRVLALLLATPRSEQPVLVPGERRNRQRVERAVRYVHQHLVETITADGLAEIAGLSPSHLTRLFRQQTGHAPMDYLRRARVQEARRLLGDVDLSIKEVAARVGFEDPYHFSKVFHRLDGLPPSLYREALLAGER